ncbi:MAG TPA: hypothetical protein DCY27_04250 [Desulfobacterales bacterium]|jgi:hypothetical protein|nr:hypothetical protein [Desulfobacterales bacterium]
MKEFKSGACYIYMHPRQGYMELVFKGRSSTGKYCFVVTDAIEIQTLHTNSMVFDDWEMELPKVSKRFSPAV